MSLARLVLLVLVLVVPPRLPQRHHNGVNGSAAAATKTPFRKTCFATFPAAPLKLWSRQGKVRERQEFLRCFELAYNNVMTTRDGDYALSDIHYFSPVETEETILEQNEYDDGRQNHGIHPSTLMYNDEDALVTTVGGYCHLCPPDIVLKESTTKTATQQQPGQETPRLRGGRNQTHQDFFYENMVLWRLRKVRTETVHYTDVMAQRWVDCIQRAKRQYSIFGDFLENSNNQMEVLTCRRALLMQQSPPAIVVEKRAAAKTREKTTAKQETNHQ